MLKVAIEQSDNLVLLDNRLLIPTAASFISIHIPTINSIILLVERS